MASSLVLHGQAVLYPNSSSQGLCNQVEGTAMTLVRVDIDDSAILRPVIHKHFMCIKLRLNRLNGLPW